MRKCIIALCALAAALAAGQTASLSQQTEVSVSKGQVKAETPAGTVTVSAGLKAVLAQTAAPVVTADDPLVTEALRFLKWIEAEKQAARVRIDYTSIQVASVENDQTLRGAAFVEFPNTGDRPSDTFRMGPTGLGIEQKFYDLEGKLIPCTIEKLSEDKAYIHLRFPKAVAPGENFKLVLIARLPAMDKVLWRDGKLWNLRLGNDTPHCLNYYRIVLPRSALLVDSSRQPILVDQIDGRTALMFRNYTGQYGDGQYHLTLLWPDKDGTSAEDLPETYRGLSDERNAALWQEYQQEMQKILAGGDYNDQSTPLRAMLTDDSAVVKKDLALLSKVHYIFAKDPEAAKKWDEKLWGLWRYWSVDTQEFLSTPPWPDKPQDGYLHPIYVGRKGCQIREDTRGFRYEGGRWYAIGNMGNPWDTEFKKEMISK